MSSLSYFGIFVWIVVIVVSAFISIRCEQPGHRRRKHDSNYQGPERRADRTESDIYEQPVFVRNCPVCGAKIHLSTAHKDELNGHHD